MPYLIESWPNDEGLAIYRRAPHLIAVYRIGADAIRAGEQSLRFIPSDSSEVELTENDIRRSMATEESYRLAYKRAGLPHPYPA